MTVYKQITNGNENQQMRIKCLKLSDFVNM